MQEKAWPGIKKTISYTEAMESFGLCGLFLEKFSL
jgi:hypothetical protein